MRIDGTDVAHAQRPRDRLGRRPLVVRLAGRRARLVAGHRRDAVVQHDHEHVVAALRGVEQRRHPRVEEGRVADEGQRLLAEHAARRRGHRDRRAHREQRVHGLERRSVAQRVAADVVEVDRVLAEHRAHREVGAAVRAARAERGRSRRDLGRRPFDGRSGLARRAGERGQCLANDVRSVSEAVGQVSRALPQHLDPGADLVGQRAKLVFQERRQLLDDEHAIHAGDEVGEHRARDGMGRPRRLHGQPLAEPQLLDLVEHEWQRGPGGEHAEPAGADAREVGRVREQRRARLESAGELDPHAARVGRDRGQLGGAAPEPCDLSAGRDLLGLDDAARVGHARRGTQYDRQAGLLGKREGEARHRARLRRRRGLENRDHVHPGQVPLVLLVRRDHHSRIAGGDDDHPGNHADVGDRAQRIPRVGEAEVLHVAEGAGAHDGGAEGGLQRDLLVDAPLEVDAGLFVEPREDVADLGGGRAGVAGDEPHPRLERAPGDRLVSQDGQSLPRSSLQYAFGQDAPSLVLLLIQNHLKLSMRVQLQYRTIPVALAHREAEAP